MEIVATGTCNGCNVHADYAVIDRRRVDCRIEVGHAPARRIASYDRATNHDSAIRELKESKPTAAGARIEGMIVRDSALDDRQLVTGSNATTVSRCASCTISADGTLNQRHFAPVDSTATR